MNILWFQENYITMDKLVNMTDTDLTKIGVPKVMTFFFQIFVLVPKIVGLVLACYLKININTQQSRRRRAVQSD